MTGNSEFFPAESSDNTELLISTGATCEITQRGKYIALFPAGFLYIGKVRILGEFFVHL